MGWGLGLALAGALIAGAFVLMLGPGSQPRAARTASVGATAIPVSARGPISAALGRLEPGYRIVGLTASDAAQDLSATFSSRGARVRTGAGRLGL